MYPLGTIREFRTKHFRVIVDAVEESDIDLSWDDDGSIQKGLTHGQFIAFCARVRVLYHGREIGSDYLGNCIYGSLDEFQDHRACGKKNREYAKNGQTGRCGSYFADMVHTAIAEARKTLREAQHLHVRKGR